MDEVRELLGKLTGMTERLALVRSLDELALAVDRIMQSTIEVTRSGVYLIDPDTGDLHLHVAHGFTDEERLEAERTAWDRHPGVVLRTGEMFHVPDLTAGAESLTSPPVFRARSRLFLPIKSCGQTVGTLGMASTEPNHFGALDIAVLGYAVATAGFMYKNIVDNMVLAQALDRAEQQRRELEVLSSPIVEVWRGVLVLPLIGRIDAPRAAGITEKLLGAVASHGSETVIVDLTGIEAIDAASLELFIRIRRAVSLLGGRCFFSGISASMAPILADIGAVEAGIEAFATLRRALGSAIASGTAVDRNGRPRDIARGVGQ